MAHHQQGGEQSRYSAVQAVLNMLRTPSANMPSIGEDEVIAEADEPPDDHHDTFKRLPNSRSRDYYRPQPLHPVDRRESLLTRALMSSPEPSPEATEFPEFGHFSHSRTMTTNGSSHSNFSVPSTAELTSDGGITSPERSNPPSPPASHITFPASLKSKPRVSTVLVKDDKSPRAATHNTTATNTTTSTQESTVEANLGRKRCITFACGRKNIEPKAEPQKMIEEKKPAETIEPPKRKCMLTFACPSRSTLSPELKNKGEPKQPRRQPSPAPPLMRQGSDQSQSSASRKSLLMSDTVDPKDLDKSEKTRFHEFEVSHEEEDEWVNEPTDEKPRITVNDCMKKEFAIRKIGEEAEEEARQDEEDNEDDDSDEDADADDLGFSDGSTDDGNESDNEEGFADSDDESDAGSDYHFWAPSTTTAATSTDQLDHLRLKPARNMSETSLDSMDRSGRAPIFQSRSPSSKRRASKVRRFRPGTPDLPDSTDFVCGTLDEDRPLEAAYISCMEERKRSKHIMIPQDIDPSFPTTDPDDNEDDDDTYPDDGEEPLWMKGGMEGIDDGYGRGRRKSTEHTIKASSHSPRLHISPPLKHGIVHRSPAPPLKRLPMPQPALRLKSPAPFPLTIPRPPHDISITGHQHGHELVHTKSLPRTPNPFFARHNRSRHTFNFDLDESSPKSGLPRRRPSHTRGPIDIVEGLEKKRQKRREKFWRQHCRKHAKEQMERKPVPGKGAERMKELGLEAAERCRGYGLGQPGQLVLSI